MILEAKFLKAAFYINTIIRFGKKEKQRRKGTGI